MKVPGSAESAMARSAYIAPRTPNPSPAAPRVVEASCTTTAETPTMARPAAIHATANAMLPVGVHAERRQPRAREHAGGDDGDGRPG